MNRFLSSIFAISILTKTCYCVPDWIVERKIKKDGEEAVLFCPVDDCCTEQAGWTKEYHDFIHTNNYKTIFVDVKNIKYNSTSKYDGRVGHNGFYLFIRNVSEEDLKLSYSCSYGFERSASKNLQEAFGFDGHVPIANTDFGNDIHQCSEQVLIPILCVLIPILILMVILVVFLIKLQCRKKKKKKDEDEEMTSSNNELYSGKDNESHSEKRQLR